MMVISMANNFQINKIYKGLCEEELKNIDHFPNNSDLKIDYTEMSVDDG